MAADSLRWSNLSTSLLLRITKGFNLNLSATWDVYKYGLNEYGAPVRINKLRLFHGGGWGRLASTGTSFSYTFNNDTFKKLFGKKKKNDDDDKNKGVSMRQATRSEPMRSRRGASPVATPTDPAQTRRLHEVGLPVEPDGQLLAQLWLWRLRLRQDGVQGQVYPQLELQREHTPDEELEHLVLGKL